MPLQTLEAVAAGPEAFEIRRRVDGRIAADGVTDDELQGGGDLRIGGVVTDDDRAIEQLLRAGVRANPIPGRRHTLREELPGVHRRLLQDGPEQRRMRARPTEIEKRRRERLGPARDLLLDAVAKPVEIPLLESGLESREDVVEAV